MNSVQGPAAMRRVGVVMAGAGAVGKAFVGVLQRRFSTSKLHVVIAAIGDSRGFICPGATDTQFEWDDIAAILDHKKSGGAISAWSKSETRPVVLDGLIAAVDYVHNRRSFDDYFVVDCTSSPTIVYALIHAKHRRFALVMANKLPVGGPLDLYKQLVQDASGPSPRVGFEATVGAGLPIVDVVRRIVGSRDPIKMIQGGLSGTMTYILSAMNRGAKFSVALKEVHELGITEADPREDLSGADVARKMVILAREMGMDVETSDVAITPLLPPSAFELSADEFMTSLHHFDDAFDVRLQAARDAGLAPAYLGVVHADGRIEVGLQHVPSTSFFATASSTEGVISIATEWFPEPLTLRGTGAGAASTAAAVAGDLAAILRSSSPPSSIRT